MIVSKCTGSQVEMAWIKSESKKGTNEIGFLPWSAIERYAAWGDIYLLHDGGELLCFAIIRSAKGRLRIFQMWTRKDVRRRQFGAALITGALPMAKKNREQICSLWCRCDIEANEFWKNCSFFAVAQREGSAFRGIMQICYERRLDLDQQLISGFSDEQPELSTLRIVAPSPLRGRRIVRTSEPKLGDASSS